jgi:hypothetical protein
MYSSDVDEGREIVDEAALAPAFYSSDFCFCTAAVVGPVWAARESVEAYEVEKGRKVWERRRGPFGFCFLHMYHP